MKNWILLVAGVVLVITPQIIAGVVAANTAWVQSAYLTSVAQVEASGQRPSQLLEMRPLPVMPEWLLLTSTVLGVSLCVVGVAIMCRSARQGLKSQ